MQTLKKITRGTLVALSLCFLTACQGEQSPGSKETKEIAPQSAIELAAFDKSVLLNQQQYISVQGNKLVDEQGQVVVLKGMNVADPDKLEKEGQWSFQLFDELKTWGVNVIRLPVHPRAWRERGKANYIKLLDQAIGWANTLDIYLIIDWHSIGYLPTGKFQHEMYATSIKETEDFWALIATRYKQIPTVAVYELFNEPTDLGGKAGKADWLVWKALNERLIDIIYAQDRNVIPLVAGFNWAYDLTPVLAAPIAREGIAYTSHPYPQKEKPADRSKENFFALWEQKWGHVSDTYPLILTELGWVNEGGFGAHIPVMNDGSYGPQIIEYMQSKGLSWVGWCFDPQWSPTMIHDWNYTPTQQGAFFKQVLRENR